MLIEFDNLDERLMLEAIRAAEFARSLEEVPIGAVIVNVEGEILATAGNRTRIDCDPTAHAEILALRRAAQVVGNYRLIGCTVYSTIEPCAMCAGALVQARVKRLVYGASDERFGAVASKFQICNANSSLNHKIEISHGILEIECRKLMQDFFRQRRENLKCKIKDCFR
jgi:tRNA(adenine34) deaminase